MPHPAFRRRRDLGAPWTIFSSRLSADFSLASQWPFSAWPRSYKSDGIFQIDLALLQAGDDGLPALSRAASKLMSRTGGACCLRFCRLWNDRSPIARRALQCPRMERVPSQFRRFGERAPPANPSRNYISRPYQHKGIYPAPRVDSASATVGRARSSTRLVGPAPGPR